MSEKKLLDANEIKFVEVWLNGFRGLYTNLPVNIGTIPVGLYVYLVNGGPTKCIESYKPGPTFVKSGSLSSGVIIFGKPIETIVDGLDLDGDVVFLETQRFACFFPASFSIERYIECDWLRLKALQPCIGRFSFDCPAHICRVSDNPIELVCDSREIVNNFLKIFGRNGRKRHVCRNDVLIHLSNIEIKLAILGRDDPLIYNNLARMIDNDIRKMKFNRDDWSYSHSEILHYRFRGESLDKLRKRFKELSGWMETLVDRLENYFRDAYSNTDCSMESIKFLIHLEDDVKLDLDKIQIDDELCWERGLHKRRSRKLKKVGCNTLGDLKRMVESDITLWSDGKLTKESSVLYNALSDDLYCIDTISSCLHTFDDFVFPYDMSRFFRRIRRMS